MIEDRELNSWREQWSSVAEPLPELRQIQRKIKRQQVRFVLDNLLAGIAFIGGLAFAAYARQERSTLGTGWASTICVFVFLSVGYRLWSQRGTWRAETQSTRAFLGLWRRRVMVRIRLLRMACYLACGWIVASALLTAANWTTIRPQFKAHPAEWLVQLALSAFLLPFIFLFVVRFHRSKVAELNEVNTILDKIKDKPQ